MIVKLIQSGVEIYVNSDHVAIVSPDTLINTSNVLLVNGINAKVEGAAREVAGKFGWNEICLKL